MPLALQFSAVCRLGRNSDPEVTVATNPFTAVSAAICSRKPDYYPALVILFVVAGGSLDLKVSEIDPLRIGPFRGLKR
jgi:hypothetical protein